MQVALNQKTANKTGLHFIQSSNSERLRWTWVTSICRYSSTSNRCSSSTHHAADSYRED